MLPKEDSADSIAWGLRSTKSSRLIGRCNINRLLWTNGDASAATGTGSIQDRWAVERINDNGLVAASETTGDTDHRFPGKALVTIEHRIAEFWTRLLAVCNPLDGTGFGTCATPGAGAGGKVEPGNARVGMPRLMANDDAHLTGGNTKSLAVSAGIGSAAPPNPRRRDPGRLYLPVDLLAAFRSKESASQETPASVIDHRQLRLFTEGAFNQRLRIGLRTVTLRADIT